MKVNWIHNFEDEPFAIYGEVNEAMDEQRKIEIFIDGSFGYSSVNGTEHRSFMSEVKWSIKEDIEQDPQFKVSYISKEEFEEVWIKAIDATQKKDR